MAAGAGSDGVYEGRDRKTNERQVDRHPRRPDLRLALAAARPRGSLCLRGLEGEVREGLRRGVDQGDERSTASISPERFDLRATGPSKLTEGVFSLDPR